jgi:hypothetical protein
MIVVSCRLLTPAKCLSKVSITTFSHSFFCLIPLLLHYPSSIIFSFSIIFPQFSPQIAYWANPYGPSPLSRQDFFPPIPHSVQMGPRVSLKKIPLLTMGCGGRTRVQVTLKGQGTDRGILRIAYLEVLWHAMLRARLTHVLHLRRIWDP